MRVILAAAQSLDGFISPAADMRSFEWTSKEDRRHLVALTKQTGVIVMGANTYRTFRIAQAPPGRRLIVYTHDPASIQGTNVETTDKQPHDLIAQLEAEGATGLIIEGGPSIYRLFLEAGAVDEVYLTLEPVLFGDGIRLLDRALAVQLQLLESTQLNDHTVLLHYAVRN